MSISKVVGEVKNFDGTDPGAAAAEGQQKPLLMDFYGAPHVNIGNPFFFQTGTSNTTVTSSTLGGLVATAAANALYITDVICSADTGPSTFTFFQDYAATAPVEAFRIHVQPLDTFSHSFRQPWRVPTNSSFGLSTSVTNTAIQVLGYYA